MNALQAIESGMDQLNHVMYLTAVMTDPQTQKIAPDSDQVKSVLKFLLEHHTVVDPTIALMEIIFHSSNQPIATFEPGIAKVAPELREGLDSMGVPPAAADRAAQRLKDLLLTIQLLHQAGVPIVAGTDQAVPGYSVDREMELYVKAGFTPMEAIQSATLTSARAMGMKKDSGTVEAGKRADVIIVDGNPLENISDIRKVTAVFAGGKMFQPAQLWPLVGFKP
jgi:imidazolonepropionase-like amidohydrolase